MKKLFLIPCLLLTHLLAFGQVNEIKESAEEDQQEEQEQTSNEEQDPEEDEDEDSTDLGSCCLGGCADGCCTLGGSYLFKATRKYQKGIMGKEDTVPRVSSLELMLYGGLNNDTTFAFWPRLRLNYGLFSTDFRVNTLLEPVEGNLSSYVTYDWQILLLNIISIKPFTLRLGGGVLHEEATDRTFGEFTLGTDVYINDRQWRVSAEYRYSPIRQEGNGYVSYRFSTFQNMEFFATAGGSYSQYYGTITSWLAQGGFYMMWH